MEDPKIEAIVSLHEWNVKKDERIAELEQSLKFAQLERDNRTSAYEVGVKIIGEQKERIAELEQQLAEAKRSTLEYIIAEANGRIRSARCCAISDVGMLELFRNWLILQ